MKGKKITYTAEQLEFVKQHCTLEVNALYQAFVNQFKRDDVSAMNLNSLRKRNGWRTGRTGHFAKGNVSHNKGKKGWCAPGSEAGWFKKGAVPANVAEVGTTRETEDGYLEMKMKPGMRQWRLLQRVIWERCNGKIPTGMVVSFLDGNKKNINIKNLVLYTNAENLQRNSIHQYPKEIAALVQLKSQISRQINKRIKNEQYSNA